MLARGRSLSAVVAGRLMYYHPAGFCSVNANEQMCEAAKEVCCTEAGAVTTEVWQHVGDRGGSYEAEKKFRYVGSGIGTWDKKEVTLPYGLRPRACTIAILCVIFLGFAAWLVSQILGTTNVLALRQQGIAARQYDCSAGYNEDVSLWSNDQKQWCCGNAGRGCAR